MSFLDEIDKDSLICTFCGKKPVVAYTFAVDVDLREGDRLVLDPTRELVQDSLVATCKEHVSILQEQFEKDVEGAETVWGIESADGDA